MKVKTDTKEKFHVITVNQEQIPADMSAEFRDLLENYLQNDVKNIVLNLKELNNIDAFLGEILVNTQQKFYENSASFVICELKPNVETTLDEAGLLELMNATPTLSEAMDIVQMEEIERELDF